MWPLIKWKAVLTLLKETMGCWHFPLGATWVTLSSSLDAGRKDGGKAWFREWGWILFSRNIITAVVCKPKHCRHLCMHSPRFGWWLQREQSWLLSASLSRLCAQTPHTNLTDPAWRIELSPQSTHGTEAEVLLSVVTPACALHRFILEAWCSALQQIYQ